MAIPANVQGKLFRMLKHTLQKSMDFQLPILVTFFHHCVSTYKTVKLSTGFPEEISIRKEW